MSDELLNLKNLAISHEEKDADGKQPPGHNEVEAEKQSLESKEAEEADGPRMKIDPAQVPSDPTPLIEDFQWSTLDLDSEKDLDELYNLLYFNYVEDVDSTFRFSYTKDLLCWTLKPPGWQKDWHIGIRSAESGALIAFISGIPTQLRVRQSSFPSFVIDFICVHKNHRSKRLTPLLVKELTRRCNKIGIFQAVYTSAIVLPNEVNTSGFYHRILNWERLYRLDFAPLPTDSTPEREIARFEMPNETSTPNLRPMRPEDAEPVTDLVNKFLLRYEMAPQLTKEDVEHMMLPETENEKDRPIWAYVVEDPENNRITDFFSFYSLTTTAIDQEDGDIHAAYLYYYATEAAFNGDGKLLETRLHELMSDALIVAKEANFDLFNAMEVMDNPTFVDQLDFLMGNGTLYYYINNYRAKEIHNKTEDEDLSKEEQKGIGLVLI